MKVKGKLHSTKEHGHWAKLIGDGFMVDHDGFYKTEKLARSAVERLAKRLNLEIEWETI